MLIRGTYKPGCSVLPFALKLQLREHNISNGQQIAEMKEANQSERT